MRKQSARALRSIALATAVLAAAGCATEDKTDGVKGLVDESTPPDSNPKNDGIGKADAGNPYLVAIRHESPHPYENNWERTFPLDLSGLPGCANRVRVHFESNRTENSYDSLTIQGYVGGQKQYFTGNHDDEWSQWFDLGTERALQFVLETDYSIVDQGFAVDSVEWAGAAICPTIVYPPCADGSVDVNPPPPICGCEQAKTCVPTAEIEIRRNVYRGFDNQGLLIQGNDAFTTAPGPADAPVATNIGTVDEDAVLALVRAAAMAGLLDSPGYSDSGEWTEYFYIRAGDKEVAFRAELDGHTPEIKAIIAQFLALFECGGADSDMTCRSDYVCADNQCVEHDECICTEQYEPVCATSGRTMGNACKAECAGLGIKHPGECGIPGDMCGTILGLTCIEGNRCRFAESTFEARWPDDGGYCVAESYCDAPTDCDHLYHPAVPGQWQCGDSQDANVCKWVAGDLWNTFDNFDFASSDPYSNNENVWKQLYLPAGAAKLRLQLSRFDLEDGYDFLEVWTWNGSRWERVARFTGNDSPAGVVFEGRYHYLHFVSDYSVTRSGFEISRVEYQN